MLLVFRVSDNANKSLVIGILFLATFHDNLLLSVISKCHMGRGGEGERRRGGEEERGDSFTVCFVLQTRYYRLCWWI